MPASAHRYKYHLYDVDGTCHVRYHNERRKGDHRHVGEEEVDYVFTSLEQLLDDFEQDIAKWS